MKCKRITAMLLCVLSIAAIGRAFAHTVVWMSDTQNYTGSRAENYKIMTRWIVDNRARLDTRYVFHTGDIVGASKSEVQWQDAGSAMKILTDAGMPFLAVSGNHDTGAKVSYSNYLDYISNLQPGDMYSEYGATGSRYVLFSDENRDYIFIGIAFSNHGPSEEECAWARDVLERYSDRSAILITHSYIKKSGDLTTQGKVIFNNIVKPSKNVFMVLCGHCRGLSHREDTLDDDGDGREDRTVYTFLSNFQDTAKTGGGYMRILDFRENDILMTTYSPVLDTYTYEEQKNQCVTTIPLPPRDR